MMEALGMVQTKGFIGLVEATDIMTKTASIKVAGYEKTGDGIVTVFIRGSVADCRIAVDKAVSAASQVGEVLGGRVIPYPEKDLNKKFPIG